MERGYLGKGIQFPLVLKGGKIAYTSDTPLIDQSINIILSTKKRTRVFVPDFGSRLSELMFEPNDEVLENSLNYFIRDALIDWEKRIKVLNIEFERVQESLTNCTITYRVLASNEIDSYIYPFYKQLKY